MLVRIPILFVLVLLITFCSTTKQVEVSKEGVTISENDEIIAKLQTVWKDSYVTASSSGAIPPGQKEDGVGKSLARDAAIANCYADLYRQFGEVKLTQTVTVLNAAVNSHLRTEMEGTIQRAKIIEDRWDGDSKMYKISMEMPKTELIKYVKTWLDDGTVDPNQLDAYLNLK